MTEIELIIYRELKPLHGENVLKHIQNVLQNISNNNADNGNILEVRCEALSYLVYVLKSRKRISEAAEYMLLWKSVSSDLLFAEIEEGKRNYSASLR